VKLRHLGVVDYESTWRAMREFTEARAARASDGVPDGASDEDEIWLCQHPPVYTQGITGKQEHVLDAGDIPVVATDRGGQVTYHGPGQVVAYPLVDLSRLKIYVKEYVFRVEHAVLKTLESFGVTGHRVPGAPGIYVRTEAPFAHEALTGPRIDPFEGLGKIAALGIKVRRHATYHGVALNVAMDLQPFSGINPCGYEGLRTIDLATLGVQADLQDVERRLGQHLSGSLSP
jgi:lipoyl(octanoyl) transferase